MPVVSEVGRSASTLQTVVKKLSVITTSQNWTVPANIAGDTVKVTACAGGGSGCNSGSSSANNYFSVGGWGGSYVIGYPIKVTPSKVIALTIGAGGAAVSSTSGNIGGDTSVGNYLTLKGGTGGDSIQNESFTSSKYRRIGNGVGVRPYIGVFSTPGEGVLYVLPSESVNGNSCGAGIYDENNNCVYGGGAGLFGRGGHASNSGGASTTPVENSGAGGGATRVGTAGAGAAGRILLEWEEFI